MTLRSRRAARTAELPTRVASRVPASGLPASVGPPAVPGPTRGRARPRARTVRLRSRHRPACLYVYLCVYTLWSFQIRKYFKRFVWKRMLSVLCAWRTDRVYYERLKVSYPCASSHGAASLPRSIPSTPPSEVHIRTFASLDSCTCSACSMLHACMRAACSVHEHGVHSQSIHPGPCTRTVC